MSLFKPPSTLSLEGNVADNWRKWKQRFQLYMEASGSMKKPEKQRVAIFLHLIGDDALEIYNTFSLSPAEEKSTYYSKNLKSIATPDGTSLLNATNSSLAFSNRLKTSISTSQSFVPERALVNVANCVRV